jgi:hypothetical protein
MLCERLVVDQDLVEEVLVVCRHSECGVFDERKGNAVCRDKSFAEKKRPVGEQPFEKIKCAHETSAKQCEPLLVGVRRMIDKLLLDRTCRGFPGTLKPVDASAPSGSAGKSRGSGNR